MCEPDFNAWTEMINPTPGTGTNLRSCGFHIWVGYESPNDMESLNIIKALDLFVGVPSVLQEPDNERKSLYGKAGACRINKKIGVEYRSTSNYLLQDRTLIDWAFNNTLAAIDFVNNGGVYLFDMEEKELIVNSINYSNKDSAQALIEKYQIKLA